MLTCPPADAEPHFKYNKLSMGRETVVVLKGATTTSDVADSVRSDKDRLLAQGLGYGECHGQHYLYKAQDLAPKAEIAARIAHKHDVQEWQVRMQEEIKAKERGERELAATRVATN
jgi:hypothetical protein